MDKASGVYLTITDNSFITGGTTQMKVVIPMLTNKGNLGLTRVTANDFKDLVGYDLGYNSNYYGLQKLIENMSYVDVWRLNQNAKIANAYFMDKDSGKSSDADCDSFEEITRADPKPMFAAANKWVGDWQTSAVKLSPTPTITTIPNEGAVPSASQTIEFNDVREAEKSIFDGKEINSGCIFYNSSDNSVVGIIKKNSLGEYKVYKVVDNEIVDDTITYDTFNAWTDGTNFYNASMEVDSEPEGEAGTPVDIGVVRSGVYTKVTSAWNCGEKYYDENDAQIERPEGTAGSATVLGKAYIAKDSDASLVPGKIYITTDDGSTYWYVAKLHSNWADTAADSENRQETTAAVIDVLNDYYAANQFSEIAYAEYTAQKDTGFYVNKNSAWYKATGFNALSVSTEAEAETDATIIGVLNAASDIAIKYVLYTKQSSMVENSVGSAAWDGSKLTVELSSPISKDTFWTVHTIPETITEWTLSAGKYEDSQYLVQNEYAFSTNSSADNYWEKINFGDIQIFINGSIPGDWEDGRKWFILDNGSNGDPVISAIDVDTSVLDTCGDNILLMNGLTDYKVVNRIAAKCQSLKIHAFVDAPAYSSYIDVEAWKKKIAQGEYIAIGGRPDQTENSDGSKIYVYPSVNYGCIFSAMMANYGNLCFPPAGPTYGTITANDLIECDYEMYQNELKTNRINWQRTNSLGTMMWEQRTNYALNTDLSYIAPIFIIDDLSDQIVTFERQFNFRYMTRSDLLTQESGLTNIFDSFVTKGFVFAYEIKMPTYEEAQRSGRTLRVPLKVQISKDAEVIELELEITNSL